MSRSDKYQIDAINFGVIPVWVLSGETCLPF